LKGRNKVIEARLGNALGVCADFRPMHENRIGANLEARPSLTDLFGTVSGTELVGRAADPPPLLDYLDEQRLFQILTNPKTAGQHFVKIVAWKCGTVDYAEALFAILPPGGLKRGSGSRGPPRDLRRRPLRQVRLPDQQT